MYAAAGWGVGEVWVRDGRLVHHVLAGEDAALADDRSGPGQHSAGAPASPPNGGAESPADTLSRKPSQERDGFVAELCRRFRAHLAGKPVDYADIEIESGARTPFEAELAHVLRAVPWGDVVTYGELAALAGRRGAARAAGSFCAAGGLSLVVPYHRVVAAGGIGGYGPNGVEPKRRLLALEGVRL